METDVITRHSTWQSKDCGQIAGYSSSARKQIQLGLTATFCATMLFVVAQTVQANPIGGNVMNGSASFATTGNTLTVTNTPGTIINWQGFSINSNEVTKFAQQSAASTVLNRVVGSDPSNIMGTLQSNGRVFLINPNGIMFGAGAIVDVAGLVASTLGLSDADFLAGNHHYTQVPGAGNISNAGNISAQQGGQIYLIAPNVENSGVITAPNGEILLAAGASVDLVNTNDPNLRVNITAPAGNATNVGQLIASSGSLGLFGTVVGNSGTVSADSATMQGGKIVFKASQLAEIGGTVSATGTTGGDIRVLGDQVAVLGNVDASGTNGGGTVLIGGDAHGANPNVQNAQYTYVDGNATIKADATENGNGGKVVVWADDATQFNGSISARGGALSGDGGWVETSGKQSLGFAGLVDTTAAHGVTGSLLLDPTDITISTAADTNSMTWTPGSAAPIDTFTDIVNTPSNLNVTTLQNQLALSNVTVDTSSGLGGAGNITVQNLISWSTSNLLTLNAAGAIAVNADITNTSTGGLSLVTAGGNINIGGNIKLAGGAFFVDTSGSGIISMIGALDVGSFTLGSGTWQQVSATLPGFTANTGFNITGGTLSGTFIRALGGDGSAANPYQLADIYGVQGMGSAGMLGSSYVLVNNIDATVTKNWVNLQGVPGFAPIGSAYPGISFTGQFNGQGHTIGNLYINISGGSYVGLFGYTANASISNVGLVNASVSGGSYVGALVGENDGTISNTYTSGGNVVATGNYVGGLIGYYFNSSGGTISASYVKDGSVNGASYVGGLVGYSQYGSIRGSYVDSVKVTGSASVIGGLVGDNSGTISNTFASGGTVSGSYDVVGGLVGENSSGSIDTSYASVSLVSSGSNVGGLVGINCTDCNATVSNSFWNTTITGAAASFGIGADSTGVGTNSGAIGLTTSGMMVMSNFTAAGWDISASGTGTIWRIATGVTMPQLSFMPVTATNTTVIDEIVDTTNQQEKPKKDDFLVAVSTLTDENGNSLPMCN